jgi:esterase/lipase superfamily enzyme
MRHLSAAIVIIAFGALSGCAGQAHDVLVPLDGDLAGTNKVNMLVATTRSALGAAQGEMFTGERAKALSFARITVSLPPDETRKAGDVQWPSQAPGDPARDFVTREARTIGEPEATARLHELLAGRPGRRVLVFVHGYNNRFEEAVYRLAQIAHDSHAPAVPLLFTWPSRGKLLAYTYDRESATYSRDALEEVLQKLVRDPQVGDIAILAHSMGNWVALETLRQMSIRDRGLPKKIGAVMLAAPDVDVDVFQRQIETIEAPSTKFSLFVSQDDKALAVSRRVWGNVPRMGAIDPEAEPYRSELKRDNIVVFDLTHQKSDDPANHDKFAASPEVVQLIGKRLVEGQQIGEDKTGLGDRMGAVAQGAASTLGSAATLAVSAPLAVIDARTRESLGDRMGELGGNMADTLRSTAGAVAPPQ